MLPVYVRTRAVKSSKCWCVLHVGRVRTERVQGESLSHPDTVSTSKAGCAVIGGGDDTGGTDQRRGPPPFQLQQGVWGLLSGELIL